MTPRQLTDMAEKRLRDDAPVHLEIPDATWRDDLADFIAEVRRDPEFALICAVGGFASGLLVPIVLAEILTGFGL